MSLIGSEYFNRNYLCFIWLDAVSTSSQVRNVVYSGDWRLEREEMVVSQSIDGVSRLRLSPGAWEEAVLDELQGLRDGRLVDILLTFAEFDCC